MYRFRSTVILSILFLLLFLHISSKFLQRMPYPPHPVLGQCTLSFTSMFPQTFSSPLVEHAVNKKENYDFQKRNHLNFHPKCWSASKSFTWSSPTSAFHKQLLWPPEVRTSGDAREGLPSCLSHVHLSASKDPELHQALPLASFSPTIHMTHDHFD